MSIRIKLLLSYTGMLIVSLLVVALTAGLFAITATGDIRSFRDFYKVHYQLNPLTEQEESIFLELKYLAKNEPDRLQDGKLLEEYDFKLKTVRAGLYVRRESNQVFESRTFNQPDLERYLPAYDLENNQIRNTFNIDERFYAYAKFDFRFSDGAKGRIRHSRAQPVRRGRSQAATRACYSARRRHRRSESVALPVDYAQRRQAAGADARFG